MTPPETRYARSGDIRIAYQTIGSGPFDLVFVPGFASNVDATWELPSWARFYSRLASFSRLILFDKRGTGLSDRSAGIATLEERMDDVRAVMDAAGSERAALFGVSEGGPMSVLFAATYPDRASSLVLYGSYARNSNLRSEEYFKDRIESVDRLWGTGEYIIKFFAPSKKGDDISYFAARHFRDVVAVIEAERKVDVIGVSIKADVSRFFSRSVRIDSAEDVYGKLSPYMLALLRELNERHRRQHQGGSRVDGSLVERRIDDHRLQRLPQWCAARVSGYGHDLHGYDGVGVDGVAPVGIVGPCQRSGVS